MNKLSTFIVKHKILIIGIIAIITIASIVALMYVNVNSDILSYLPEDMDMTDGMNFMKKNFDMQGDAIVGVSGVNYAQMTEITKEIAAQKGIKPGGVIWIGSILAMKDMQMPGGIIDDMLKNEDLLKMFYPKREPGEVFDPEKSTEYMVMLQLNVPTSSDEALDLLDNIDQKILKDYEHALGGSTKITKDIFDSTIGEIWKYLIVAVLVMFIVLLLTTNSLIEPIIFMVTLGISIAINMGTNIILPSVSVVTFAASSILQLGLSMDYAIFLMHAFAEEKEKTLDNGLAMQRAIPRTFSTILASALTTVGGFLALFFMKFKIGADLGLVLAKGVFLSLLTVIFLQPCLMLISTKLHDKTAHKIYLPKLKKVGSFSVTHRKVIVLIAVLLIVPTMFMQNMVELNYIKFTQEAEIKTEIAAKVDSMSNSVIVIVPTPKNGEPTSTQYRYLDEIRKLPDVNSTMGLYAMIPEQYGIFVTQMINSEKVPAGAEMMKNFASNGYTMYSIMLLSKPESEESTKTLNEIKRITTQFFPNKTDGSKNFYITGMTQAVEDLKAITPTDFAVVSFVSILLIFIVLLFALKSVKISALLIAVIEFGIFINLSISFIFHQQINFMAYIIISSIQLGATVDYAILYTVKYQRYLEVMSAKEAGYRALSDSAASVITSVAIMAGCCLSVSLVTTNVIVGEITMMIARGSIISGILVLVLLPALLVFCTGNKKLKTTGKHLAKRMKNKNKEKSTSDNLEVTADIQNS